MDVITAKNLAVPSPSGDWMQKLKVSLAGFAGPNDPLNTALYDQDWRGRHAVHCLYSVGLSSIIDPQGLDRIDKPFCWRFVAGGHKAVTTAAGCWATHEAHALPPKIMATFRGPEMAEMLLSTELLNELAALKDHPNITYELRVLRIPALYLEAFWLKCPQRDDWIVPYGLLVDGNGLVKVGAEGRLNKNKAYPLSEFLQIAGQAARLRLASHNALFPDAAKLQESDKPA
jgi:hypothetical protein